MDGGRNDQQQQQDTPGQQSSSSSAAAADGGVHDYQEQDARKAARERRWRVLTTVMIVILGILFLLLWISVQQSEKGSNVKWRNWWTHGLTHFSSKLPFIKRTPMLKRDMTPGTWLTKKTSLGTVPVMYFQRPHTTLPAINWLRLPQEVLARSWLVDEDNDVASRSSRSSRSSTALEQMALVRTKSSTSENASRHPINVLFFHGAGMGNENYYRHLQQVAVSFNVNVLSVEIPGFGEREATSKTYEESLLVQHPQEIYEIVQEDMEWRWCDTVIWTNCFSAQIAFRTMWYISRIKRDMFDPDRPETVPAALFLSKVLVSYRHSMRNLLRSDPQTPPSMLTRIIPKNLFTVLPAWSEQDLPNWLRQFYPSVSCPVLFWMGGADKTCSVADAEQLRKRFVNAPWTRMHVMPGAKHSTSMLEIAQNMSQQEATL